MAMIRNMKKQELERDSMHSEVDSTYTVINNDDGIFLQIDTYGSKNRVIRGKKSQSIRFSPDALKQLKSIMENEINIE